MLPDLAAGSILIARTLVPQISRDAVDVIVAFRIFRAKQLILQPALFRLPLADIYTTHLSTVEPIPFGSSVLRRKKLCLLIARTVSALFIEQPHGLHVLKQRARRPASEVADIDDCAIMDGETSRLGWDPEEGGMEEEVHCPVEVFEGHGVVFGSTEGFTFGQWEGFFQEAAFWVRVARESVDAAQGRTSSLIVRWDMTPDEVASWRGLIWGCVVEAIRG